MVRRVLLVLAVVVAMPAAVQAGVGVAVSAGPVGFATFQGPLARHGHWVAAAGYGRAWQPWGVSAGWRPYAVGQWEWTEDGWYWDSDEPWAWATYHYGRWVLDPFYGWVWIPGYEWAPAWVAWRYGDAAVGWAPLGPGMTIYDEPPYAESTWVFVPCTRFVGTRVERVAYGPSFAAHVYGSTAPAAGPRFRHGAARDGRPEVHAAWGGPPRAFVESRLGHPLTPAPRQHGAPVREPARWSMPPPGERQAQAAPAGESRTHPPWTAAQPAARGWETNRQPAYQVRRSAQAPVAVPGHAVSVARPHASGGMHHGGGHGHSR